MVSSNFPCYDQTNTPLAHIPRTQSALVVANDWEARTRGFWNLSVNHSSEQTDGVCLQANGFIFCDRASNNRKGSPKRFYAGAASDMLTAGGMRKNS